MSNFINTIRPTPFGFFDSDADFQTEADNMITFVYRKLGESILSVELTKKDIWLCFEEACDTFSAMMLEYQARSNLATLLGTPTGSNGSINLTNVYVKQNLEFLERQAEPYAGIIGYGTDQNSISGSIRLEVGRQDYDLYTELKNDVGVPIYDLQPDATKTKMKIFEIFHFAPIQYVFNSNFASNMVAAGMPVESYIPDTRFYVLPLFEDVLRAGMLEAAQRVRRSNYSYKVSGRILRIFPTPTAATEYAQKVWVRVGFVPTIAPGILEPISSGSFYASGSITDQKLWGVSTPANIPYGVVPFHSINQWGRHWIRQYTFILAQKMLGYNRDKYKTFPIPGSNLQLNGADLISHAREDKEKMLDTLKEKLESLTYEKLAEQEATKAEQLNKQLQFIPVPPTWTIKMG
jgi:hypothetical protein